MSRSIIMSSDTEQLVLPFGKYRGMTIDEILEADDSYAQWLARQQWFRERFGHLQNYIARHPPSTAHADPVKNRMQNLFLKQGFLDDFAGCLGLGAGGDGANEDVTSCSDEAEIVSEFAHAIGLTTARKWTCDDGVITAEMGWRSANSRRLLTVYGRRSVRCSVVQFETSDGYPVKINIARCCPAGSYDFDFGGSQKSDAVGAWEAKHGVVHRSACAEDVRGDWNVVLRPIVGSDYASLLRHTHHCPDGDRGIVLFVARYECDNVTSKDELRQLFGSSGVRVVFMDELNPEHFRYVFMG